jgi:hypothetical protein
MSSKPDARLRSGIFDIILAVFLRVSFKTVVFDRLSVEPSAGTAFNEASSLLMRALCTSGGTSRNKASRLPNRASNVLSKGRVLPSTAFRRFEVDPFLCMRFGSVSSLRGRSSDYQSRGFRWVLICLQSSHFFFFSRLDGDSNVQTFLVA